MAQLQRAIPMAMDVQNAALAVDWAQLQWEIAQWRVSQAQLQGDDAAVTRFRAQAHKAQQALQQSQRWADALSQRFAVSEQVRARGRVMAFDDAALAEDAPPTVTTPSMMLLPKDDADLADVWVMRAREMTRLFQANLRQWNLARSHLTTELQAFDVTSLNPEQADQRLARLSQWTSQLSMQRLLLRKQQQLVAQQRRMMGGLSAQLVSQGLRNDTQQNRTQNKQLQNKVDRARRLLDTLYNGHRMHLLALSGQIAQIAQTRAQIVQSAQRGAMHHTRAQWRWPRSMEQWTQWGAQLRSTVATLPHRVMQSARNWAKGWINGGVGLSLGVLFLLLAWVAVWEAVRQFGLRIPHLRGYRGRRWFVDLLGHAFQRLAQRHFRFWSAWGVILFILYFPAPQNPILTVMLWFAVVWSAARVLGDPFLFPDFIPHSGWIALVAVGGALFGLAMSDLLPVAWAAPLERLAGAGALLALIPLARRALATFAPSASSAAVQGLAAGVFTLLALAMMFEPEMIWRDLRELVPLFALLIAGWRLFIGVWRDVWVWALRRYVWSVDSGVSCPVYLRGARIWGERLSTVVTAALLYFSSLGDGARYLITRLMS
ncbi:hypothetical protein MAIT1_01114 [Magnetofaba australis IT-1]|uniref:Uncharacterized protein n=1 Tax=Magnetofaba australis IT-1 TaxID=1434232 RepID=A0A1Y2K9W9_9PROT|nr:hypothetical protein MAIT1_01114 [Magnetofaba australis IT-1]